MRLLLVVISDIQDNVGGFFAHKLGKLNNGKGYISRSGAKMKRPGLPTNAGKEVIVIDDDDQPDESTSTAPAHVTKSTTKPEINEYTQIAGGTKRKMEAMDKGLGLAGADQTATEASLRSEIRELPEKLAQSSRLGKEIHSLKLQVKSEKDRADHYKRQYEACKRVYGLRAGE